MWRALIIKTLQFLARRLNDTVYFCKYMAQMSLSEELKWRGFVHQTTIANLSALDKRPWTFYHGYDASADSLTIGNLAGLMLDKCFIRHGHKAIALLGGATSQIGDPGGKNVERVLQPAEAVAANIKGVDEQIEHVLGKTVRVVNNLDWFKSMSVLTYLREVGKYFSMTPLVQRDYIAKRMGKEGSGISYTEFSYTLLQGYDFLHLYKEYGVELQLAGSDQWGNSLSGVELVRKVTGKEVHVLTIPLVINQATGVKFGKSEEGAIWLAESKTSVFRFYQFWLNVKDEAVESYLKLFTELDKGAIGKIMDEFNKNKPQRSAQKKLAWEVTKLIHGHDQADSQARIADALASQNPSQLGASELGIIRGELPSLRVGPKADIVDILVKAGLAVSNSEARQLVKGRAVYINGENYVKDEIGPSDYKDGKFFIRKGKVLQNTALIETE